MTFLADAVLKDVLNLSNVFTDSAAAIVDDSFNKVGGTVNMGWLEF